MRGARDRLRALERQARRVREQVADGRAGGAGRLVQVDDAFLGGDEHRESGHRLRHRGEPYRSAGVAASPRGAARIDDTRRGELDGPVVDLAECLARARDTSRLVERRNISGTGAYEPIVGYSRAVVVGDRVHVSGTAANPADGSPPPEDIYEQTRVCLAADRDGTRAGGNEPRARRAHARLPH